MHHLFHLNAGHFGHAGSLGGFILVVVAVSAMGFFVALAIDKSNSK
jgi:hypothetical protein